MSAVMFPNTFSSNSSGKLTESRIPVPSSPVPLRRSASVRLPSTNNKINRAGLRTEQAENTPRLQRGNSFMERGEKRGKHGAIRPQILNRTHHHHHHHHHQPTESPRTPSNTTQSPARLRSLSLSLSSARLTHSPNSPSTSTSAVAYPSALPKTPSTSPLRNHENHIDWDTESLTSITSINSIGSCDHASVARNGTTFSGRSMRYVFHCSQHAGATGEDYLTPTQRVHRQVKKLQYLLHEAKKNLDEKDSDILKLTKEVVELRLYKAALNSPEDKSNSSSDVVTVKENNTDEDITTPPDLDVGDGGEIMTSSLTDSGHEDDHKSPINTNKKIMVEKGVTVSLMGSNLEHNQLIIEYERRLQELVKMHEEETYQLKQKQNDKVEELLQRISEINQRYWELVPELDIAKEKIKELETQLQDACDKLLKEEEEEKKTYVDMYNGGGDGCSRISVPELLQELQVTKTELENIKDLEYASSSNNLHPLLSAKEALSLWVLGARKAMYRQLIEAKNKNKIDPEITLQFLKSALYYFLTDKENSQGHLRAIQSILGFTPNEISNIDKARLS